MITVDEYIGQHLAGHEQELTDEIRANAEILCGQVNQLLAAFDKDRGLRSGWRPAAVNHAAGGAMRSRHMTGQAIDVEDDDGLLDAFCRQNIGLLEQLELWLEDGAATPSWTHIQCVPPRSGRRFFMP